MAHFAKLDDNNVVLEVLVVGNEILLDEDGNEVEQKGIDFLISLFGHTKWKQCSYNNNFRKKYPSKGWVYSPEEDVFFPTISPYDTFMHNYVFDRDRWQWVPPIPMPVDGFTYNWDPEIQEWVKDPDNPPIPHPLDGLEYIWDPETNQWVLA